MKHKHYYIDAILILVTIIWSIKPTVIKIGLRYIDPIDYNVLRLITASLTSWFFVVVKGDYKVVSKKDMKNILFISVCGFFIFQWFYGIGIDKTTAGNTSVIMGTIPLIVAAINHVTGIHKASINTYRGILISITGVIIVVLGTNRIDLTPDHIIGSAYILLSAIGYGVYMVFSKPMSSKYSASIVTAYSITITTILSIAFSGLRIYPGEFNLSLLLSLLYSGIFAMYIGNFIWTWAIKNTSSNRVSIYNNLTPVFSVISASLLLGEEFTFTQGIGFVVIVFGLYVSTYRKIEYRKT